jgi:protein-S-isoprenylcysteine O-methyltransferase Ste14
MNILAIRSFALLLPLLGAVVAWLYVMPSRRTAGATYLATLWTLPSLVVLHLLAQFFEWWSFEFVGGGLFGMPVDLLLGWALLWGALPALLFPRMQLTSMMMLAIAVDLVLMPLCAPVVQLGAHWLTGELVAVTIVLLPAQLLARWTIRDEHLGGRVLLQFLLFSGVVMIGMPAIVLTLTRSEVALQVPYLAGQCAILAIIVGLSAVQEFAERGGGTPFPYDPPKALVRSGIYAYVRNPMQLSTSVLFVLLALVTSNKWLALVAVMSVVYSAGLAAWDEGGDLRARYDSDAERYMATVRNWFPVWRPRIEEPSTIYFAAGCDPCSDLASWLQGRNPRQLLFVPAEHHPTLDLDRVRYEAPDGYTPDGVAAIARALEHIHLGWALVGFSIRLPIACTILQVIVDASGGGRRRVIAVRPFGDPSSETDR